MLRFLRPILLAATLASPAAAQEALRPDDQARLVGLDGALGRALRQVLWLPEASPDRSAALAALSGAAAPADPARLTGDWACRTIKMGRTSEAVAYGRFACRISARDGGLWLEKLSGSQRLRGMIQGIDGEQVFAGVGFIAGDDPPGYAALPPGDGAMSDPQRVPVVGLLEVTGPGHARLMMPSPVLESDFDLLDLTR